MKTFAGWREVGRAMRWARQQDGVTIKRLRVNNANGFAGFVHTWNAGDAKVGVDHSADSAGFSFENTNVQFDQFYAEPLQALRVLAALGLIPAELAEAS